MGPRKPFLPAPSGGSAATRRMFLLAVSGASAIIFGTLATLYVLEYFVLNSAVLTVVNLSDKPVVSGVWSVTPVEPPGRSNSYVIDRLAPGARQIIRFKVSGASRYDARVRLASGREFAATVGYVGDLPNLLSDHRSFDDAADLVISDRGVAIEPTYPVGDLSNATAE